MALKHKIINLLARLYRFVPFSPRIILMLLDDINNQKHRHVRARLLRAEAGRLAYLMKQLNYKQKILVSGEDVPAVESEGIFLDCSGTNKYLKVPGTRASGNAGYVKDLFLKEHDITPKAVIDIGANFGEFSLFFCKKYPNCRVLAIEASPDNFAILQKNIQKQFFDTTSIIPINLAVADKKGSITLTAGVGQSNTIILDDRNETYHQEKEQTVEVKADTLLSIAREYGFKEIDFVKINIEGAEPLLTDCLLTLKPRAMHIEYSSQNTFENNLQMIVALNKLYNCYQNDGEPLAGKEEVNNHLEEKWGVVHQFSDGKTFHRGAGLWFTRRDNRGE